MRARDAAQGKWEAVLTALGIEQDKLNPRKHHPCPKDGSGVDRFRFANRNGSGNYFCACSEGDKGGIDLLMCCKGWDFKTAAREVERVVCVVQDDKPKKSQGNPRIRLREIAKAARPVGKTVSDYLASRGLIVPPGLKQVRWKYWDAATKRDLGEYECMAGLILDAQGKAESYHLTYLDGAAKANVPSPKKMMPPLKSVTGCAVRLFPMAPVMGIAEGIETAIAASMLYNMPVWAVLSAHGMESFAPPDGLEHLTVFVDSDESFTGQAAGFALAKRLTKTSGIRCDVRIPDATGDFNDELLAAKPLLRIAK